MLATWPLWLNLAPLIYGVFVAVCMVLTAGGKNEASPRRKHTVVSTVVLSTL
jgi:hypothetical protein